MRTPAPHDDVLKRFLMESNSIEGMRHEPSAADVKNLRDFLECPSIGIDELWAFAIITEPSARLRLTSNMTVQVGNYIPPEGGQQILYRLEAILDLLQTEPDRHTPFRIHCMYESLHPFTDGNGRTGRALYLRHSLLRGETWFLDRDFLHEFYYRALNETRT